jgi:nitroreductase
LGLGAVVIGAFDDPAVKALLTLPPEEEPLYLLPFGRP